MLKLWLIFLGAGFGGVIRYAIGGWVQALAGSDFPWGTVVVNVSGCLAMGFLAAAFDGPVLIREEYRTAILVGVLGGYTTFSSFGRETMALAADGEWLMAGLNVLLSNVLSLAAVWVGSVLATRIYGSGVP